MAIAARDKVDPIQRRFELLVTARLRRKTNINRAVKTQNRIREKAGAWHGSEEIRKWRDRR